MRLLLENWREFINEVNMGFDMTKSIEYTAFVLDKTSHEKLSAMAPEVWTVKAHHMTIIRPHEMKSGRLDSRWLEFEGCFTVTRIAQNDQVMTALVNLGDLPLPMKGPTMPHVTIAINPATGGEAKMSNAFQEQDYEPIEPEPKPTIQICGKVEEVLR